jgi:spore maturation protein CgeB
MRILYAATKYDRGQPEAGLSFEHFNFYESLLDLGHDILYFDYVGLLRERGRQAMNRRLLEVTRSENPDVLFSVLLRDELDPGVMQTISDDSSCVTINWFCDDHWRFETFSSRWATRFNWVVTTAQSAVPKYRAIGYDRAIKSQWACNPARYRPVETPKQFDVTFVGAPHGDRRVVIERLRSAGIDVRVWGHGWDTGRIAQDDMIRLFSQSRINLNLSNSSPTRSLPGRALDFATRLVEASPASPGVRETVARSLAHARRRIVRSHDSARFADQIKGRNFEIPGCAGFLLTGHADNLEDFYIPDREVVCFSDGAELAEKIRSYLQHPEARDAIARAGYERTLREHTYQHRFNEIFERVGLSAASGATFESSRQPGTCEEVR